MDAAQLRAAHGAAAQCPASPASATSPPCRCGQSCPAAWHVQPDSRQSSPPAPATVQPHLRQLHADVGVQLARRNRSPAVGGRYRRPGAPRSRGHALAQRVQRHRHALLVHGLGHRRASSISMPGDKPRTHPRPTRERSLKLRKVFDWESAIKAERISGIRRPAGGVALQLIRQTV